MSEETDVATWQRVVEAGIQVLRIPTPFQVGRVNCYLIEDDPLTLVDAGPNSGKALDELEHQLAALGHRIEDIELVDHHPPAHRPPRPRGHRRQALGRGGRGDRPARRLSSRNFGDDAERDDADAAALMLRHGISEDVVTALRQVTGSFRAWGSKAEITRPLHDGETLERCATASSRSSCAPGTAPPTPSSGTSGARILIAGDHLIKHISSNPLMSRPLDGSGERPQALVDYLESLQKTRMLPAEVVLSGHGEPISDHAALIDERLGLHQRRAEKLYGLIAEQPRTGHELAQALWGDVAVTQAFLTLSEVIGHVDLLVNAGHVREAEDGEVLALRGDLGRAAGTSSAT